MKKTLTTIIFSIILLFNGLVLTSCSDSDTKSKYKKGQIITYFSESGYSVNSSYPKIY